MKTIKTKRYMIEGRESCRENVERLFGEYGVNSLNIGLSIQGFSEMTLFNKDDGKGYRVRCELREEEIPSIEERLEEMNSMYNR